MIIVNYYNIVNIYYISNAKSFRQTAAHAILFNGCLESMYLINYYFISQFKIFFIYFVYLSTNT